MSESTANEGGLAPGHDDDRVERSEPTAPSDQAIAARSKAAEMKRNFNAVFGHGVGKAALIIAISVVVILLAVAIRQFQRPASVQEMPQVDVVKSPVPTVRDESVTPREAARRAEVSRIEAERAAAQGKAYQAPFDPKVAAAAVAAEPTNAEFNLKAAQPVAEDSAAFATPPAPPRRGDVQAVANTPLNFGGTATTPSAGAGQGGNPTQRGSGNSKDGAAAQAQQQRQEAINRAKAERNAYVAAQTERVMKQVEGIFGNAQGAGGVNDTGAYETVSYRARTSAGGPQSESVATGAVNSVPSLGEVVGPPASTSNITGAGRLVIRTGNVLYATLDSEINTDDGSQVIATVHGGEWDGSKLIGKVDLAPRNIRLHFETLAPQDGRRETLKVDAVALREEDAKQGMADHINHHTISRYSALAVSSILSGVGQAFRQQNGTTLILPNGGIIQTSPEVDDRRIIGMALGELGTNAGREVAKGFNRPTTYRTDANRGFAVFFLQDVRTTYH